MTTYFLGQKEMNIMQTQMAISKQISKSKASLL